MGTKRAFNPDNFSAEISPATSKPLARANHDEGTVRDRTIGVTLRFPHDIHEGLRDFSYKERQKINPFVISLVKDFLHERGYL